MSDYSNTFGGAAKDAADDIILGSDFDTEFDAIATASATKANKTGAPATTNNLAMLTATGDLADSLVESDGSGNITANVTGNCTGTSGYGAIQVVTATDAVYQNTTTAMVLDDTIPTTTEGSSLVDVSITPVYADSILVFHFEGMFALASAGSGMVSLIDVTGASCLTATNQRFDASAAPNTVNLHHVENSPGTSSNTYRIRYGPQGGNTMYANGSSVSRLFGGVAYCRLTVTEIRNHP